MKPSRLDGLHTIQPSARAAAQAPERGHVRVGVRDERRDGALLRQLLLEPARLGRARTREPPWYRARPQTSAVARPGRDQPAQRQGRRSPADHGRMRGGRIRAPGRARSARSRRCAVTRSISRSRTSGRSGTSGRAHGRAATTEDSSRRFASQVPHPSPGGRRNAPAPRRRAPRRRPTPTTRRTARGPSRARHRGPSLHREGLTEPLERHSSAGLDGAERRAGPRRDLGLRQPFVEGELQNLALRRRQLQESRRHERPRLHCARDIGPGPGISGAGSASGRSENATRCPQRVDRPAAGHHDQPGLGAPSGWIVVRGAPPGLEEDLLQHLLGVRAIANDPDHEVEEKLGVAVIQALEPGAITLDHAADQRDRVRGHRGHVADRHPYPQATARPPGWLGSRPARCRCLRTRTTVLPHVHSDRGSSIGPRNPRPSGGYQVQGGRGKGPAAGPSSRGPGAARPHR